MKKYKSGLTAITILGVLLFGFSIPSQAQECGEQEVDLVIMIDRTLSVSQDNLIAQGNAVKALLEELDALPNSNVNVAVGRFPEPDPDDDYDAALLNGGLTTDYQSLITLVEDHFILTGSGDFETPSGFTNIKSANDVAGATLAGGTGAFQYYILFSDGDPNRPINGINNDVDALDSAQDLKDAGVINFMIAYDASGDGDDVDDRLLMAMMAHTGAGDDGCGGDSCTAGEELAENTDLDHFFIAAGGEDLDPIFAVLTQAIQCPEDDNPDDCFVPVCNTEVGMCEQQEIPGCGQDEPDGGPDGGEPGVEGGGEDMPGAGVEGNGDDGDALGDFLGQVEGTGCANHLNPGSFHPLVVGFWLSFFMAPAVLSGLRRRRR